MSTNHDMAFHRLRRAKPEPATPVFARSAAEFLDELEDDVPEVLLTSGPAPGTRRPLLAAAVVVLVLGATIGLATTIYREPPVDVVTTSTEVVFKRLGCRTPLCWVDDRRRVPD